MKTLGIFAADPIFQEPDNRAVLREHYKVRDFSGWRDFDQAALLRKMRSVEVILTGRQSPRLPHELAEDFGRLRYLCHLHGTIRHLADKKLLEAGLIVTNWGDAVSGVAEGAMALLLGMLKQLVTLNACAKGGRDERTPLSYPPTLYNRDVGLYGYGPIGRHMARMLEPFGARLAIYDPYALEVPRHIRACRTLRDLFATCQIVSIHCGLNDQTRDSVTRELLELLPQGGIVVNTARGAVVGEKALADLVKAGRLLAGIDVIRDERHWPRSPLAPLKGAVLTRHRISGGKVLHTGCTEFRKLPSYAVRNLRAYARGEPLIHVVTADIYDLKT